MEWRPSDKRRKGVFVVCWGSCFPDKQTGNQISLWVKSGGLQCDCIDLQSARQKEENRSLAPPHMGDLSQACRWSISKSTSRCLYTLRFFPFLENTDVNGGVASNYHNARLKDANYADNIKSDLKDQTQITFSSSLNTEYW